MSDVSVTLAFAVDPPDAPVMVTVFVPVCAELLTLKARVLCELVLEGLNDAVTPVGRPEFERLTLPAKPWRGVTVMVLDPLAPCCRLRLLDAADKLKLGGGC